MKVTLDTNAVVSGIFWLGNSNTILHMIASGELENVTSEEIFKEHDDVCFRDEILGKTDLDEADIRASLDELRDKSAFVNPKQNFNAVKDDPKDNKFIDAAYEGKSKYVITNDRHLLKLKEFKGVKMVTPEDFIGIWISNQKSKYFY